MVMRALAYGRSIDQKAGSGDYKSDLKQSDEAIESRQTRDNLSSNVTRLQHFSPISCGFRVAQLF